jgi:predicted ester cyclase
MIARGGGGGGGARPAHPAAPAGGGGSDRAGPRDRADRNKEIARRFREDLWNSGDLAIADEIIASNCLVHARVPLNTDFVRGPDALRQLVLFYHLAFSDIRMTVDQVIAEDDTVAARWTGRGRPSGELLGLPAAGAETVTTGIDYLRIAGGQIVEGWVAWDILSLVEQLLPAEEAGGGGAAGVAAGPLAEFLPLLKRLR